MAFRFRTCAEIAEVPREILVEMGHLRMIQREDVALREQGNCYSLYRVET